MGDWVGFVVSGLTLGVLVMCSFGIWKPKWVRAEAEKEPRQRLDWPETPAEILSFQCSVMSYVASKSHDKMAG